MREVDVGFGKALLIKESGQYSAVGHRCTHYGAPLVKGNYDNGNLRVDIIVLLGTDAPNL
jgi:nitrite reductase/ring-hydroxylating ferredoxin subunit